MKLFLDVPYAEKDIAKANGAKWYPTLKKWYADDITLWSGLSQWIICHDNTTVFTYGLTKEEHEHLEKCSNYSFKEIPGSFLDLLENKAIAVILDPNKLSKSELEKLADIYIPTKKLVHKDQIEGSRWETEKYIVIDIETTGFSPAANKIIELGAVKIENGVITEEFNQLVNPGIEIPWRITKLTGITSQMVAGKPTIEEALPLFLKFCADHTIVAHNTKFDMGFIKYNAKEQGLRCSFKTLDTLEITRRLFPQLSNHQLSTVAAHLDVKIINHHRATDDAKVTAGIFLRCEKLKMKV